MIWWTYFVAGLLLAALSPKAERASLLIICACLCLVAGAYQHLTPPAFWIFSALIWIICGLCVTTMGSGNNRAPALLLVVAGLLVAPGRFWGAYEAGNPFLAFSDICGVAAMLLLGRPAIARVGRGIGRLGVSRGSGVARDVRDL